MLVARGGAALIAQTYVSSHPASALVLINPPTSTTAFLESLAAHKSLLLPTALREFDFEPLFPVIVFSPAGELESQQIANRLIQEGADLVGVCEDDDMAQDEDVVTKLEEWLDDIGV